MSCGTPGFQAPELFDTAHLFSRAVDVYAFGIMLYTIVTSLNPFPDVKTEKKLGDFVRKGERPSIPDTVPAYYRRLMEQCWAQSPIARPPFRDIARALSSSEFLAGLCRPGDIDVEAVREYDERLAADAWGSGPIEELRSRADHGDVDAQKKYGFMMLERENPTDGAVYLRMAAAQGDSAASVAFGRLCKKGNGVPLNVATAAQYFRDAAELHDPDGLDEYATLLRFGSGVDRDERLAADLYWRAARNGHAMAQVHYGEMLLEGRGVAKNIEQAIQYFRMDAAKKCPQGMFNLADIYRHGRNVTQNITKAQGLYERAAQEGLEVAAFALCEMLMTGEGPVRADPKQAAEIAKALADRGGFLGFVAYAKILRDGIGVPPNEAAAAEFTRRANNVAFSREQNNLGYARERGSGCRQDEYEAVKYYRIAAENGDSQAMVNIGWCCEHGIGIDEDLVQAASWYRMSADRGYDRGCYLYGRCLRSGTPVGQNDEEPVRYFKIAAGQGNALARRALADMYEKGEWIPQNEEEAQDWCEMARETLDVVSELSDGSVPGSRLGNDVSALETLERLFHSESSCI
jgi:TPR repeat protein